MLRWSDVKYKFTVGIGSLAIAGMLSELWRDTLSVWAAIAISMLPLFAFIFLRPGEVSARLVWLAHVFGSAWYLHVSVGLLVLLAQTRRLPLGWPIYLICVAIGAVPCSVVLFRALTGKYRRHELLHILEAETRGDHRIWLSFSDGVRAEIDIRPLLKGAMFEPLLDLDFFRRMSLDAVCGTVIWPNGADFAPEALHALVDAKTVPA